MFKRIKLALQVLKGVEVLDKYISDGNDLRVEIDREYGCIFIANLDKTANLFVSGDSLVDIFPKLNFVKER